MAYEVITPSLVSILVTSVANKFGTERRFQKSLTVAELKGKLELLAGANQATMKLTIFDKDNKEVCRLEDNSALLGSYPIDDGMRLHVEDVNLKPEEFEDVSKVQKFELTPDEYAKRPDSFRAYKEKNKLGRFDPDEQKRLEESNRQKTEAEEKILENMKIGDRCEVRVPDQTVKRGTVKYFGKVHFKPGYWVGVQYDEPLGKNDGNVDGHKYFDCPPKYGGFVKPLTVMVGDFPEEDYGLNDEEDEI